MISKKRVPALPARFSFSGIPYIAPCHYLKLQRYGYLANESRFRPVIICLVFVRRVVWPVFWSFLPLPQRFFAGHDALFSLLACMHVPRFLFLFFSVGFRNVLMNLWALMLRKRNYHYETRRQSHNNSSATYPLEAVFRFKTIIGVI